jgi:PTH1 family peptidyl-tRNA hydrolase
MFLIVGLGNPGKQYEGTRHNVGFMALDVLAEELNTGITKVKFKGLLGETFFQGDKIFLLKPHTYMNLSGQSVLDAVNFYKIPPEKLLVIYDDMDLPVGSLRIRPGGGTGGHKGMESIIYLLGTDQFPRIRVGIGKPDEHRDTTDHVLGKVYGEDAQKIQVAILSAANAALAIVTQGVDEAMNRYNSSNTPN